MDITLDWLDDVQVIKVLTAKHFLQLITQNYASVVIPLSKIIRFVMIVI